MKRGRGTSRGKKRIVSDRQTRPHLIVGIGASAGGLEAFTQLLQRLPTDTGMAFILIQHLDPTRESALSDILSRATSLPVNEVTRDLPVKPDNIYVIAPGSDLTIADGTLKLQPRKLTGGAHRSIDLFFESLAQDQHERAVGVILSGTATDGTLGLEAIRGEGGLTFAQDDSARYDSMPRSAIAAGCVDLVLSPQDIAAELGRIAKHPLVIGSATEQLTQSEDDRATATAHEDDGSPLPSGGHGAPRTGARTARAESAAAQDKALDSSFKKILLLLRNHCGVDFSLYKSSTIQRRTTRRMVLNRQHTLEDYCRFLRGNAKELDALYSDVLISVTSFFRNPEAFDILKRKVFQKLLQRRGDDPLRVWVLGCSTGQEAYSLAMAFVETVENVPRGPRNLQVFATDLNEALLNKARHGLYAKSLVEDISPERLRRFFVEQEDGYRVTKSLREMVVFARQNLISDPPFSRMDLVSCRNLLIYLEPNLQKALLPTFHYALKPGGYLFLGSSESIGSFTDLFEQIDKKHKVYAKKTASPQTLTLPARKEPGDRPPVMRRLQRLLPAEKGQGQPDNFRAELNLLREADRIAINKYAPPAVLINAEFQILQFRGPTSVYLEPPTGKASFSLLKMAREGLRPSLQAVLNRAKKENIVVRTDNAQLKQNGKPQKVSIEVIPLKNLKERSYLVVFDDVRKAVTSPSTHERSRGKIRRSSRAEGRHVADVERELSETRDFLQSVQEQNESVNEELQASNEEVQSANEELQSINEELETAKEELESTNEELTTVNEELANRNFELNRLNSDLVNLQTSTHLAIVLVGRDLSIRRFSIRAKQAFNLLASDIGRSFNDVRHNLDFPDLEKFVGNVISSVREAEREVRDKNGHWYSVRVRPYLTLDNKVDGAVLVVIDIDLLKRTQLAITEASEQIEAIVRTVPDPLVVLEPDLTIRSANEAFYHTFRLAPPDTEGRSIFELDEASWNIPSLRQLLEDIIPHRSFFNAYEITHEFKRIGRCTMLLNARMLLQTDGKPKLILLGIRDITERKEAEERHNLLTDELAHRSKNLLAVIQSIASRSLSGTRSLDDARDVFIQRIQALSRGQSALLSEGIEGASLVRTIQLELEAFSEQIESSGPDLVLHSRVAQSFTLLIHELATNASKHGALSRPEGKIVVRWSVEGGGADARFKFQWHERNGPPVQPPSHRGFGHVLLELAATDFDASPMIDFSSGGFRYEIDAPLSAIVKQRSRKQDS